MLVGKNVSCPKCKQRFVVRSVLDDDLRVHAGFNPESLPADVLSTGKSGRVKMSIIEAARFWYMCVDRSSRRAATSADENQRPQCSE